MDLLGLDSILDHIRCLLGLGSGQRYRNEYMDRLPRVICLH